MIKVFRLNRSFDESPRHLSQAFVVVARVRAKSTEGVIHIAVSCLADDAFGLLDDDATVECVTQLFVQRMGVQ